MTKIGFTTGKFLPLSRGHELMLQVAANTMTNGTLYVVIGYSDNDPFTVEERTSWVKSAVENFQNTSVHVIGQKELDKYANKDAQGTITDERYWDDWLFDIKKLMTTYGVSLNEITHVFSSDVYGQRIANEFGPNTRWVPVDPDREMVPISGTKIRNNFYENFDMLPPYTKASLAKVVAICGAESSGKSTMIVNLSKQYATLPEYGRILSVHRKNDMDYEDFHIIQETQNFLIQKAKREATFPIVVSDTEAMITALYADIWFNGKDTKPFYDFAKQQKIDMYIVLAPTVPWIQDGFRVMNNDKMRWNFFDLIIKYLNENNLPYKVIDDPDYSIRLAEARQIIQDLIPHPKY